MPRLWTRNLFFAALAVTCLNSLSGAQAPSSGTSAAPAVKLQPYTAPDQTVSAGVPPGWKVTKGGDTVVVMTGPNKETIFLGTTAVVRNGPFQPGQRLGGGLDMSMPNAASLPQKLTMIMQNNDALNGTGPLQMNITSATPVPVPAALGQCGRFAASVSDARGPMTVGVLMCSLPIDSGGIYKVIFKLASAPPSVATQEHATAAAVFASYRIPAQMLQRKLAPHTAAPVMPAGGMVMPAPVGGIGLPSDPTNSDCMDLIVIRETPRYQLPRHCGGTAPD